MIKGEANGTISPFKNRLSAMPLIRGEMVLESDIYLMGKYRNKVPAVEETPWVNIPPVGCPCCVPELGTQPVVRRDSDDVFLSHRFRYL